MAFCADCRAPLNRGTARATVRGYVCTDQLCESITHRLASITPKEVMPFTPNPVSREEQERILAMYDEGASISAVSRALKRSREAVRRVLNMHGVLIRDSGHYSREYRADPDTFEERRAAIIAKEEPVDDIAFTGRWVRHGMIWVAA